MFRLKATLAATAAASLLSLTVPAVAQDEDRMAMIDAAIEAGDAAAGARVYRQCQACHAIDREQNRVGPHLVAAYGRSWGAIEGFRYSPSLLEVGNLEDDDPSNDRVWTTEDLTVYLTDPKDLIPRGRMAFRGLRKEEDVANVIAYLATQTKEQLASE